MASNTSSHCHLRLNADNYLSALRPDYQPMSEEKLKILLRTMGATEDTYQGNLDNWKLQWNIRLQSEGGVVPQLALKPELDDPSIQYFVVPDCPLAIRIWDGEFEDSPVYYLDLFDVCQRRPVNAPYGYLFMYDAGEAGRMELRSLEKAYNVQPGDVPRTTERWSSCENSILTFIHPHGKPFDFQLPVRPRPSAYPQPVRALP